MQRTARSRAARAGDVTGEAGFGRQEYPRRLQAHHFHERLKSDVEDDLEVGGAIKEVGEAVEGAQPGDLALTRAVGEHILTAADLFAADERAVEVDHLRRCAQIGQSFPGFAFPVGIVVQFEKVFVIGNGFIGLALLFEHQSPPVISLCQAGVELDRHVVVGEGVIGLVEAVEGQAAEVVSLGIVVAQFAGFGEVGDGAIEVVAVGVRALWLYAVS